ncbi:thermonuclease family protein [Patescibacteria group bacterium]|nr:thermonuclease family protein [Patescibacteria group bacterium]
MILSKKNQKLLISLVVILLWTIFVPKDIGQEQPNEVQNAPVEIASDSASTDKENLQKVKVLRVVDGDTIELEGGQKVRYIGIDTPETVDPRRDPQCFGKEASLRNKTLVEGKEIYLEKDISEIDRYGRLLRYIYLEENGISINEQLVQEGYAVASSYAPDIKYQEKFKTAEQKARDNQKGLWQEGLCSI